MNEDEKNNAPSQPENGDAENKEDKKPDASDNLTPDHPRFKEVVAEKNELKETVVDLQTQLTELKDNIEARQEKEDNDALTEEEEASFQRIQKELTNRGAFVTKDDLKIQGRAAIYTRLEDKHNGEDGLPKFVPADVIAHAKANGFDSDSQIGLDAAYRDLHYEARVQLASKGGSAPEVPGSEKPTGGKENKIPDTELTPEQIAQMSDEEYDKNRAKILAGIKPKRVIE